MGNSNQFGDLSAGDIATTVNRVYVTTQENALVLSEILERIRRLERGGSLRTNGLIVNMIATCIIAAYVYTNHRQNRRGLLARRRQDNT